MKNFIFLAIVFLSFTAQASNQEKSAECTDLLANDRDSNTFQINIDRDDLPNYGRDHLANGIVIIRELLKEEGCSKKAINFGKGPEGRSHSRCGKLHRASTNSMTCYIESNLGYFILNIDYHSTANIIFSRWD